MKKLNEYKNGNYSVKIYEDGTKVRETEFDEFIPEFPENIDIKISDKCDLGCAFCHENSTPNGEVANFNQEFLWSLREGTELAIGGGNVFENPQLRDFLLFCRNKGVIANLTINQSHAYEISVWGNSNEFIDSELDGLNDRGLLNGVGISYNGDFEGLSKFYNWCQKREYDFEKPINTDNFVIHVINGVHSFDDIMKIASPDRKILILGYKDVRRGIEFRKSENETIIANQKSIYDNIHKIFKAFKVVSFDNLAIEQLEIRRCMTSDEWEQFYMGKDASHTMYIDLVKEEFSMNSCTTNKRHKLLPTIDEMFKVVVEEGKEYFKDRL